MDMELLRRMLGALPNTVLEAAFACMVNEIIERFGHSAGSAVHEKVKCKVLRKWVKKDLEKIEEDWS